MSSQAQQVRSMGKKVIKRHVVKDGIRLEKSQGISPTFTPDEILERTPEMTEDAAENISVQESQAKTASGSGDTTTQSGQTTQTSG